MKSNTPVIGKIPRMVPEWMGTIDENGNLNLNENGVWTANLNAIPDIIGTMVGLYLEDALPQNILDAMKEYKNKYNEKESIQHIKESYNRIFARRIVELQHTIKETEEKKESPVSEAQTN
jgi:hypothetical protein